MTEIKITKYIDKEGDVVATVEVPSSDSLQPVQTKLYAPKPEDTDNINFITEITALPTLLRRVWELGKESQEIDFKLESLVVD